MPPVASATAPLLVFSVSGRLCALATRQVREILPMVELGGPPNLPDVLEGLLWRSGVLVPVIRLSRVCGLADADLSASTVIIVLRAQPSRALLVDRALAVANVADGDWEPVAERTTLADATLAEVMLPHGRAAVLDPERLLLREEAARIEAFRRMEQSRLSRLGGEP